MSVTKADINTRADIEILIKAFYKNIANDATINHFFKNVQWDNHLPIMYNFWESVIFGNPVYSGNAVKKHENLHHTQPLNKEAFTIWLTIFNNTVDNFFAGNNAELAKQRAASIATIMQIKILHNKTSI